MNKYGESLTATIYKDDAGEITAVTLHDSEGTDVTEFPAVMERAADCINALAGIEDVSKVVAVDKEKLDALIEAAEAADTTLKRIDDKCNCETCKKAKRLKSAINAVKGEK